MKNNRERIISRDELLKSFVELCKFGIIGLTHNMIAYVIYLLITWLGVNPKLFVIVAYPAAATFSFYTNRKWTFYYRGDTSSSITRYVISHVGGFAINLAMLYLFVDILHYPHQLVFLVAIFVVAAYLFFMMKYFVFPREPIS